jgi:hypothetical protein
MKLSPSPEKMVLRRLRLVLAGEGLQRFGAQELAAIS